MKPAGRSSVVGKKRKSDGPAPSAKPRQNKRRNPGRRKLDVNEAEFENQLGNIFDLVSLQQDQPSDTPESTAAQLKSQETQLNDATLLFGSKIKDEAQEENCPYKLFRVEGMSTTIRDYQAVGAAFMLRQERSRNGCRGGIIADDMGIGKTVQSIACMLANPPSKKAKQASQGATLIIVPNQGLVKQWAGELLKHAQIPKKKVCKYAAGKIEAVGIQGYPYVLATYSQVERDFRLHSSGKTEDDGPLFEVEFHRIILDEGDNIKNYYGSTSKACCKLNAQLKWVLSGTPMRNSLKECLPYFRFLGIDVEENWPDFEKKWGTPKSNEVEDRTKQILLHIMFRREAGQRFLGRNMCSLPKSHIENRVLPITDEERTISEHTEQAMIRVEEEARQKAKKNQEPDLDGPKSNYRVRCTRLRQAVDHPFLLEKCIRDTLNTDELVKLLAELEKIDSSKIKVKNEAPSSGRLPSTQPGEPSLYELVVDIKPHLGNILSSHDNSGCLECFSVVELQSLDCGHVMCRSCYQNHIDGACAENKKQCKCPQCGKVFATIEKAPNNKQLAREEPVKIKSESVRTSNGQGYSIVPRHERGQKSPGDDYNGMQPQMSISCCSWMQGCDKLGTVTPSTKTNAAIDIVKGWQNEAPDDKIVIFTEWIVTAKVLGRMLNRANIDFVYYTGHIPVKSRDKNLEDFKDNPGIKVMVSTMAAGNVGLNITVANRMIIMNPWWNCAAEAQAFGRLKRHGQTKETYMVRLFAEGTIDERILKLQKRKVSEIREAMSQGLKLEPLSQAERRWLMGDRDALESLFDESDDETLGADDSDDSN
ncbi:P-loop containing nucleoside triphosphate hydrolase protein [Xylaria longipes]|nr:P-loop containing nucleoside triphosphate hydrolase protein [Xylaria longipes]